jgi:Protein of unknown function (DUF3800)
MMTASIGQQFDAGSYLRNLSQLVFPLNARERVMCMLAAYFDESGTHAGSPVICMSGYVAGVEQWIDFSRNWQDVLKPYSEKYGIDCFHMTDFEARQPPFDKLGKHERINLIESLIRIINSRIQYGVGVGFLQADFDRAFKGMEDMVCGAWGLCASICLTVLHSWADLKSYDEPFAYIFEQGARHSGAFKAAYDKSQIEAKAGKEYRLGSFTLDDRRRALPLQAADILAYEAYKYNYNLIHNPHIAVRKSLDKLLRMPHYEYFAPSWVMDEWAVKIATH